MKYLIVAVYADHTEEELVDSLATIDLSSALEAQVIPCAAVDR